MAVQLSLVEEFGFVRPFESSEADGALRIVRHELTTEKDDGRDGQLPIDSQLQTIECIERIGRLALEPSAMNRRPHGQINFLEVQVIR
jgi:hypothetical protein